MNARQVTFLQRLIAEQHDSRSSAIAREFQRSEGLGTLRGSSIVYSPDDWARARNLLLSRGFPLELPTAPYTRGSAPPGLSEKVGALRVTEGLLAVSTIGVPGLPTAPGSFIAMPTHQARALGFEVLVLVENLEALIRIHEYQWLQDYLRSRSALAVYRGAPAWFRTDTAANFIRTDHRPVLAFFDFDPAGLGMAAGVPRREALCLPPWKLLEPEVQRQQRRSLFQASYDEYRSQLESEPSEEIQAAWNRMTRLAMGLDQEHFPTAIR